MSTSNKPIVIGLGGLKEHGKDAVADHLVDKHGFVKIGMSDILAEALYILNPYVLTPPLPGEQHSPLSKPVNSYSNLVDAIGYTEAKRYPEVRRLLQNLGTEVGRQILGESIWIEKVVDRVQALVEDGKNVVITGVRFENEVDGIDELADITTAWVHQWWVDRPGYIAEESTASHSSENTLTESNFDETIHNQGTLEELYTYIDHRLDVLIRFERGEFS